MHDPEEPDQNESPPGLTRRDFLSHAGSAGLAGLAGIDPDIYARRWRILPVLCISLTIIMVGNGSLNVALPVLAHDLHASTSALQWMVDTYALVFAGLLFTAGTIGDRYGRKGTLQAGLLLFLIGAGAATLAHTAGPVIVARAIMGMAAALVMPSTLSILTNVFPPQERGRAISIWAGVAAGGAAIGPSASGFLLEHFWWGSVFLINVPLVILALVAGVWLVPTSRDPARHPFDLVGALLSILSIGALVYAIIEAPNHGWGSTQTLMAFTAAIVLLGLFGWREHTARHPMLDLGLFRDPRFSVASAGMALAFFALFGSFFFVTQYLQLVLGYSPFTAGLVLLPVSALLVTISPQAPKLVARFGVARVTSTGLAVTALGLLVLSRVQADGNAALVELALVPLVSGMAVTMTPLTTLIMSAVPLGRAGVGSAMNDTTREVGGALGVAVLGSLVTTQFTASLRPALVGLTASAHHAAGTGLSGALGVASRLPGPAGRTLAHAARAAFVNGVSVASLTGAAVVFITAAAAYFLLPRTAAATSGTSGTPATAATAATASQPAGCEPVDPVGATSSTSNPSLSSR